MITYSQSFVEFLRNSDHNISKLLYKIHIKNMNSNKQSKSIVNNSEIDYITFRNNGTISYLPNGKECHYNDNGDWKKENRQEGKPSKAIRKLFTKRALKYIKDVDFEDFANEYKAKFNGEHYRIEILPNTEIRSVYHSDLREGEGSLNKSCMNTENCFGIYTNCKALEIVAMFDKEDKLCGRSLLWTLGDIKLMDRFYVCEDFMYQMFLDFCEENKFWHKKSYKSYDDKALFIDVDGNEVNKNFTVYTNTDFGSYPYIDTFSFGEDGELNNYSGQYDYNSTDGTREGDHNGQIYDEINEEYINEDDSVYINNGDRQYRDRYTHIENTVCIGNEYYYDQDSNIIEISGEWYLRDSDEICYSEYDSEYYLTDDCVYSEHHSTYILTRDAVEVTGNYYHKDDVKSLN